MGSPGVGKSLISNLLIDAVDQGKKGRFKSGITGDFGLTKQIQSASGWLLNN